MRDASPNVTVHRVQTFPISMHGPSRPHQSAVINLRVTRSPIAPPPRCSDRLTPNALPPSLFTAISPASLTDPFSANGDPVCNYRDIRGFSTRCSLINIPVGGVWGLTTSRALPVSHRLPSTRHGRLCDMRCHGGGLRAGFCCALMREEAYSVMGLARISFVSDGFGQ